MTEADLFPYQLHSSEAQIVVMALRSYLSRKMAGDGAARSMEILRDDLELRLHDLEELTKKPVEVD